MVAAFLVSGPVSADDPLGELSVFDNSQPARTQQDNSLPGETINRPDPLAIFELPNPRTRATPTHAATRDRRQPVQRQPASLQRTGHSVFESRNRASAQLPPAPAQFGESTPLTRNVTFQQLPPRAPSTQTLPNSIPVEPKECPKDLPHVKITDIQPFYDYLPKGYKHEEGRVPGECDLPGGDYMPRVMTDRVVTWEASNLYHNPLYFNDPTLERYGHTHHDVVQPFVSTGRFAGQLLGLPYSMTIDPICKKRYTLGFYRPGECVPYLYHQVPFNSDAFVNTYAFYSGAFFLFP